MSFDQGVSSLLSEKHTCLGLECEKNSEFPNSEKEKATSL